MDKAIKRRKVVESYPIAVGVEVGAEICREKPTEKGVICTGKKVYRHPLPSTYKETELSEDLNDGMEWVFIDYGRSLKQEKEPLPPRDDVMEFDVITNTKELKNNLRLQGFPSDLQDKVEEMVTEYWDVFCEDVIRRHIRDFLSVLTQITIHLSVVNHIGTELMSLRLFESWFKDWIKMVW